MVKVTKRKMGKLNITVTEHFSDDPKCMEKVKDTLAEFYVNEFRKMYPEEVLDVALPVFQRILDLQRLGFEYEESKKKSIDEFNRKILPQSI